MPSKDVYLSGKVGYSSLTRPDQYGKYNVKLYFSGNSDTFKKVEELKAEGLKNTIGKDEDGYFMYLRRPHQSEKAGKITAYGPPKILDSDGRVFEKMIGRGSDVTCKLQCYWGKMKLGSYYGSRLEAVRVDNLVPYEPSKDFDEREQKQVSGLSEQPEPIF